MSIEYSASQTCGLPSSCHRVIPPARLITLIVHRSLSTQHNTIACLAAPQSCDRLVDVRKLESFDLRPDLVQVGEIQHLRSVSGSPVGSPATVAMMLDFANLHQIKPEIEKFKFTDINKAIARLRSGEARYRVVDRKSVV